MDRCYLGSELDYEYTIEGLKRIDLALNKKLKYRKGGAVMDPKESEFSAMPEAWLRMSAKNLLKEYGTADEAYKFLKQFPKE